MVVSNLKPTIINIDESFLCQTFIYMLYSIVYVIDTNFPFQQRFIGAENYKRRQVVDIDEAPKPRKRKTTPTKQKKGKGKGKETDKDEEEEEDQDDEVVYILYLVF